MYPHLCLAGAQPGAADKEGDTPLHACVSGWQAEAAPAYVRAAQVLLAAGADPLAANHKGESPLSLAGFKGLTGLEQLLAGAAERAELLGGLGERRGSEDAWLPRELLRWQY